MLKSKILRSKNFNIFYDLKAKKISARPLRAPTWPEKNPPEPEKIFISEVKISISEVEIADY